MHAHVLRGACVVVVEWYLFQRLWRGDQADTANTSADTTSSVGTRSTIVTLWTLLVDTADPEQTKGDYSARLTSHLSPGTDNLDLGSLQ